MNTKDVKIEPAVLDALPKTLARSVRGQTEAIEEVSEIVECFERDLRPRQGCRGAFLFVGPTGSGKTELGKALSQTLYGARGLLRIDVGEFALPQSLEIALGDGHHIKGRFAAAHDRVPKGVWLFDEIEKGCPEFKNLLIQIIYESQVTLASGRTLDFSDIYVIATSNLGSREILERNHLPFESLEQHVVTVMEKWFLPELLARFEAFIVFRPLDWDTQEEITRKRLDELVVWHRERHQRIITYDGEVVEFLLAKGFSPRYGARPLLRTIDRFVARAILHALRNGHSGSGKLVIEGEQLRIKQP